jgi:hypothetical protein
VACPKHLAVILKHGWSILGRVKRGNKRSMYVDPTCCEFSKTQRPVKATLLAVKQKLPVVQHTRSSFDGHADGTGASILISSEKKELLRRDYAMIV